MFDHRPDLVESGLPLGPDSDLSENPNWDDLSEIPDYDLWRKADPTYDDPNEENAKYDPENFNYESDMPQRAYVATKHDNTSEDRSYHATLDDGVIRCPIEPLPKDTHRVKNNPGPIPYNLAVARPVHG